MSSPRRLKEIRARCPRTATPMPELAARMPRLVGCSVNAEEQLKRLRVAVIGCGSIGMRIALHLSRLGLAVLVLVDPKLFKPESLLTHEISPTEVGQAKAMAIARRCKAISPGTRVIAFIGNAQELPLEFWLDQFDLIVLASDNLAVEAAVGQTCLHLALPLLHASLLGDVLTTHVRFFANQKPHSPCPACAFGRVEREMLDHEIRFNCDTGVSAQGEVRVATQATRSFSYLCSMAADLSVNLILRFVLGLGEPAEDTIVEYCGFTSEIVTSSLEFNPNCRCDHCRYTVVHARSSLPQCSLRELARTHAGALQPDALEFTVGESLWFEQGMCSCPALKSVRRFMRQDRTGAIRCPQCGESVSASPFHTHRTVTAALLDAALDLPLRQLGAKTARYVLVRSASEAVLVRGPQNERSLL